MTKLKYLRLRNSVESPALEAPRQIDQSRDRDRFDIAKDAVELEDVGHCVRISGKYGRQLVAWANVAEAWEADEPTTTGTAQAAASKTRGAK
jgi:hypothetical protein